MIKQSLVEIKYGNKGMAENGEKNVVTEADLAITLKELSSDQTRLGGPRKACLDKEQDCKAATKS